MKLTVDHTARRNRCRLNEYKLQMQMAALDNAAEPQEFAAHWEQLELLRNGLASDIMPWTHSGPVNLKQVLEHSREQYVRTFGDPQDPAYQREMQELIDYWEGLQNVSATTVEPTGPRGWRELGWTS